MPADKRTSSIWSDGRSSKQYKNEWMTPPNIVKTLGPFDLDPAMPRPKQRPWNTAVKHYTVDDNGLMQPWNGRVWLNPPYGKDMDKWLAKMVRHGNGILLTFARTDTPLFFDYIWHRATALLFIKGRLYFYHTDGKRAVHNAGAPSVLAAYGEYNALILADSINKGDIEGYYVYLRSGKRIQTPVSDEFPQGNLDLKYPVSK